MTIDSIFIDNPITAAKDIDRTLSSAIRYKRPVYIELPRDKVSTPIPISQGQYPDPSTTCLKTAKVEVDMKQTGFSARSSSGSN